MYIYIFFKLYRLRNGLIFYTRAGCFCLIVLCKRESIWKTSIFFGFIVALLYLN